MTTNRLAKSEASIDRPIPPQGNSPEQKAARQRFWIEHGNARLTELGMTHLHWVCVNGSYSLEERHPATAGQ